MDGARSQDGSQERVRSGHNLPMIRRQNQQDSPLGLDIGRGRKDSGMIPRFLAQASGSMGSHQLSKPARRPGFVETMWNVVMDIVSLPCLLNTSIYINITLSNTVNRKLHTLSMCACIYEILFYFKMN